MRRDLLISVAGLIGRPVQHKDDQEVGKLVDFVFRWNTGSKYPPLAGILVRVGRRTSWISAEDITAVSHDHIKLRTARLDLRDFKKRDGEILLAQEVLDHQLVDVTGARVVRASDLYVAKLSSAISLVGVDVGYISLLRRLAPSAFLRHPHSGQVIDWAAIQSFGGSSTAGAGMRLAATRNQLHSLRPSELADLLEDLGRDERQELMESLETDEVADALEEMQPEELEGILRESTPEQAAAYLSEMAPDEAADALRDVDGQLRESLLALMDPEDSVHVEQVLAYDEDLAGGFMTTALCEALPIETIGEVRDRLLAEDDDHQELDTVVVVDAQGKLINDIPIINLFLATDSATLASLLVDRDAPVTVTPDASLEKVAEVLIANRHSSVLVVDPLNRPIGRILADDVVDALLPETKRFRLPRLLQ
jgi:hypothetical protein